MLEFLICAICVYLLRIFHFHYATAYKLPINIPIFCDVAKRQCPKNC